MPAPAITVLKNNVPWGPFTRAQIDDGLARGDFTLRYLAHAPGLKEWLPLGEVLDYVDRPAEARQSPLPPVPEQRALPPLPVSPLAGPRSAPPKPTAPPVFAAPAPPSPPPSVFPPVVILPQPAPPTTATPPALSAPAPEIPSAPIHPDLLVPAPFAARVMAFIIDCGILLLPLFGLFLLGALGIEFASWWEKLDAETRGQRWELLDRNFRQLAYLVIIGLGWIYDAFYESSPAQATIGKRWMGLKVTDDNGHRIGFLRATGRYAGKYLSALPCFLGFILPLFSSRGLALHDRLADTRVVRS